MFDGEMCWRADGARELVSGANLLTAGILLVSLSQWAAGALGYQLSAGLRNAIKQESIWSP